MEACSVQSCVLRACNPTHVAPPPSPERQPQVCLLSVEERQVVAVEAYHVLLQ